jgi:SAM-dependent methyltransferase
MDGRVERTVSLSSWTTRARITVHAPEGLRRGGLVLSLDAARRARAAAAARCAICGSSDTGELCTESELAAQQRWVRRFHERRLDPVAAGSEALRDRGVFTQEAPSALLVCGDCGLVFRARRPTRGALERRYRQDHYGAARLWALFTEQRAFFRGRARTLDAQMRWDRRPRVVEVGSFVGGFLDAARAYDWDVVGVDPGVEVTAFCRARRLPVIRGTLDDVQARPGSLDAVAIWNTFDQLPDPAATLRSAWRLLRPDGVLVVRVPSGAFFRRTLLRARRATPRRASLLLRTLAWNNLLGFPYLFGYTPAALDRLAGSEGFRRSHLRRGSLVRLSDRRTRRWARLEERVVKAAGLLTTLWTCGDRRRAGTHAPWLDVYYRRCC